MDVRALSTFLHSTALLSLTLRFTLWKPSFHLRQMIGLLHIDNLISSMGRATSVRMLDNKSLSVFVNGSLATTTFALS